MARVLDEMPSVGPGKYPWDQWLDGRAWELLKAEDYPGCKTHETFEQQARRAARDRGLTVALSRVKIGRFQTGWALQARPDKSELKLNAVPFYYAPNLVD